MSFGLTTARVVQLLSSRKLKESCTFKMESYRPNWLRTCRSCEFHLLASMSFGYGSMVRTFKGQDSG